MFFRTKQVFQPARFTGSYGDLDACAGFLLRECKSKDPVYKARAKAALEHVEAARKLAKLGYDTQIVGFVASRAVRAAKGA